MIPRAAAARALAHSNLAKARRVCAKEPPLRLLNRKVCRGEDNEARARELGEKDDARQRNAVARRREEGVRARPAAGARPPVARPLRQRAEVRRAHVVACEEEGAWTSAETLPRYKLNSS